MIHDPSEFLSHFASVENLFSLYEVPSQLQSKLLLLELKLTAEQYRDKFRTAIKRPEESNTLFGSRVKNLFCTN